MDPIHPIIPLPPVIPPVTPAPLIGRIDRDDRRRTPDEERRRRRRPGTDLTEPPLDERDDDGDPGLHINVTA